jgi:hypothetical protein
MLEGLQQTNLHGLLVSGLMMIAGLQLAGAWELEFHGKIFWK